MIPALTVLAVSLGICAYVYFGYPALVYVLGRLRPRPVRKGDARPPVSIIVPVYNEEAVIAAKIENCLALEYPGGEIETLVVSDGSTDRTEAIARTYESPKLRLLVIERQGKAFALNEGAKRARGEVLVFTDANSMLEPGSLMKLVSSFADPEVGGVCGNQKYRSRPGADSVEKGESLYWRYDKWLKLLESRTGSIFAADGSLYAVRKSLYAPMVDPAQADDIAISVRVVLQGYRLVYDADAVTWEDLPVEGEAEFIRKVRITNHSVRALLNLGRDLWRSGFYSVELLSHKLVRHLVPFPLIAAFLSNVVLADYHTAFRVLLLLQALFYGLGALGFAARGGRIGRSKLLSVPYYFCLANAAAFLGVLQIMAGKRVRAWQPRSWA